MRTGQHSIWSRVGTWLKNAGRPGDEHADGLSPTLSSSTRMETLSGTPEPTDHRWFLTRSRRQANLDRREHGYQEVMGVIGAIHKHLESQDTHTEEIARSLGQLADTAAAQRDTLATIAQQLQTTGEGWQRCEQTLSRLPELADAQRDTVAALGRRIDAAGDRDERMAGTLEGLRSSMDALGTSANASTAVLRSLHHDSADREGQLSELIRLHNRRFTWLFVATLVFSAMAAGIGVFALLQR